MKDRVIVVDKVHVRTNTRTSTYLESMNVKRAGTEPADTTALQTYSMHKKKKRKKESKWVSK